MEAIGKSLHQEKRKYPRFNIDLPVKYDIRSDLPFEYGKYGRVVNASEGGLLVHLPEDVKVGQHLTLQLFFPSRSQLNTLETSVQVVWMGVHLKKDWTWDYPTGMEFLDIPPRGMAQFKNLVQELYPSRPVHFLTTGFYAKYSHWDGRRPARPYFLIWLKIPFDAAVSKSLSIPAMIN